MSNRRRKNTGNKKIARNLAIRIRRGAVKLGNPLPGHSRTYTTKHLEAKYAAHGEQLRERIALHTAAHWRGGA